MKKIFAACWLVFLTALAMTGFGFACGADLVDFQVRLKFSAIDGALFFSSLLMLLALIWLTIQASKAIFE